MNPMSYSKAGAVIMSLQDAGYSNQDCNDVCRALVRLPVYMSDSPLYQWWCALQFLDQTDEDMRGAWKVFAKDSTTIDTFEFRNVLPLMGESVPDNEVRPIYVALL